MTAVGMMKGCSSAISSTTCRATTTTSTMTQTTIQSWKYLHQCSAPLKVHEKPHLYHYYYHHHHHPLFIQPPPPLSWPPLSLTEGRNRPDPLINELINYLTKLAKDMVEVLILPVAVSLCNGSLFSPSLIAFFTFSQAVVVAASEKGSNCFSGARVVMSLSLQSSMVGCVEELDGMVRSSS